VYGDLHKVYLKRGNGKGGHGPKGKESADGHCELKKRLQERKVKATRLSGRDHEYDYKMQ